MKKQFSTFKWIATLMAIASFGAFGPTPDANAAASIRFLELTDGPRTDTFQDDQLVATRLKWDGSDRPLRMVVARNPFTKDILPFGQFTVNSNATFDFVSIQLYIAGQINAAIEEWNDAGARFKFQDNVSFSDFFIGFDDFLFFGPQLAALDRYNLITAVDESATFPTVDYPLSAATTYIYYINRDIDLSDSGDFPEFATVVDAFSVEVEVAPGIVVTLPRKDYDAGTILDADIVLNPAAILVINDNDPDSLNSFQRQLALGSADFQTVITRELGHVAGVANAELFTPTMSPIYNVDYDPYKKRELTFDDKLALKMAYEDTFDRLGKAAISGRVIRGFAVDNNGLTVGIPEVQLATILVGRVNNDGFVAPDDVVGVDEDTSFTNKVRLLASTLSSQQFQTPLFLDTTNAQDVFRDNRYLIPGLPASSEPIRVESGTELSAGNYILYLTPPVNALREDEAQNAFADTDFPQEFFGGAVPWQQTGQEPSLDANTSNDFLVQNGFLQFAYTLLGAFDLRFNGVNEQILGPSVNSGASYISYRIVDSLDGSVTDLANYRANGIITSSTIENDIANLFTGEYLLSNRVRATQQLFLDDSVSPPVFRARVTLTNLTTRTLSLGTRYLMDSSFRENLNLSDYRFFTDDLTRIFDREVTLLGPQIPDSINFGSSLFPELTAIAQFRRLGFIAPDKVQFVNYGPASQIGRSNPILFDYVTNLFKFNNPAYIVQFDARPVNPGESIVYETGVTFRREAALGNDGPIAEGSGFTGPGTDSPSVYKSLSLGTGEFKTGVNFYTNEGLGGFLQPGTGDGSTTGTDDDGDGVPGNIDNCPGVANPDQTDTDGDGIGDACDPDTNIPDQPFDSDFTNTGPGGVGGSGIPANIFTSFGGTFGDLNSDGYPDLVIANAVIVGGAPSSLVSRIYLNVPETNPLVIGTPGAPDYDPTQRRFVDVTFGTDGTPSTADDRMPFTFTATSDVRMADFDNDGDLDLYLSNFSKPGSGFIGYQNYFYENVDVDDPSLNPDVDTDTLGDGFMVDRTLDWDPGILDVGPLVPYVNLSPIDGGLRFDVSTHSDVGDIDSDGDIDVIVSNRDNFADSIGSIGSNLEDSGGSAMVYGLRFSERVLVNQTRAQGQVGIVNPTPRFIDDTLGRDYLFGWLDPADTATIIIDNLDRMPPLKPEWSSVSPTNPFGEADLSRTNQVRMGPFNNITNANGFVVFDERDGQIFGATISAWGSWDGDDMPYSNLDFNLDGVADGYFFNSAYGAEAWLLADDGTLLSIGIPDGLPGDATSPEIDLKNVSNSMTQSGLLMDLNYDGLNDIISVQSASGNTELFNVFATGNATRGGYGRGIISLLPGNVQSGHDHDNSGNGGSNTFYRRTNIQDIARNGRSRAVISEDFNLDGLPDMMVVYDTNNTNADVNVPAQAPGLPDFIYNQDYGRFQVFRGDGSTTDLTPNLDARATLWAATDDIDLDGDFDVAMFNNENAAAILRNNRKAGVPGVTTPGRLQPTNPNIADTPLFVDMTTRYLNSYFGAGANVGDPNLTVANITVGADMGDLDGDGDLDLGFANGGIFSTQGERQLVYKNNGRPLGESQKVFTPFPQAYGAGARAAAPNPLSTRLGTVYISPVATPAYDVKFVDINGDGARDIIYANNGADPITYINEDSDFPNENSAPDANAVPDGIFRQRAQVPLSEDRRRVTRKIAVGDVNNDGFVDIVLANGIENLGAPNVILINTFDGTDWGNFTDETNARFPTNPATGQLYLDDSTDVALVDIDNDGDLDIIFANRGATIANVAAAFYPSCRLLLNNGTGVFTEVTNPARWPMVGRSINSFGVLVGDFTSKGEAGEDTNGNRLLDGTEDIRLRDNAINFDDGNGNTIYDISRDVIFTTADTTASDVFLNNLDSDDPLVNASPDGDSFGDGFFVDESSFRMPRNNKFPSYGGSVGDVNGDGLLDVAIGMDTSTPAGPQTPNPVRMLFNTSSAGNPAGGVFADSSLPELPFVKVSDGINFADSAPGNCRDVELADIDNDGDLDMIICQAGNGRSLPTIGWGNNVLVNMSNGANLSATTLLRPRNLGSPVLSRLNPDAAMRGYTAYVTITGERFVPGAVSNFGAGVNVVATQYLDPNTLVATINVAPNASLGGRTVMVQNPDGQNVFRSNSFTVFAPGTLTPAAADSEWLSVE